MITLNERKLWWNAQDSLAGVLANKTPDEINEILDDYNYLLVQRVGNKVTPLQRIGRLFTIPLIPVLLLLGGVKWVLTGDRYLDSWFKKVGLRDWVQKWMF